MRLDNWRARLEAAWRPGRWPSRHDGRECQQQCNAPDQCGIEGVAAKPPVNHLSKDNCHETSHKANPPGRVGGQVHSQQKPGDGGGGVLDFYAPAHALGGKIFEGDGAYCANQEDPERVQAEEVDSRQACGRQGGQHPAHDAVNRRRGVEMRGRGDNQLRLRQWRRGLGGWSLRLVIRRKTALLRNTHFLVNLIAHRKKASLLDYLSAPGDCFAAAAFMARSFAPTSDFARRMCWTRGRPAGQTYAQHPHSMQSITCQF